MKNGIKHFFIPDPGVLKKYIKNQKEKLEILEDNFTNIETELKQYDKQKLVDIPKISIFDGVNGIKNLYNDIYENVLENKYLVIKFFASNTFESQISVQDTLKDFTKDVFDKLNKKNVTIHAFLGNGILIMEQISKTTNIQNLNNLPAGNSAINIFVVGKSVYLVIYKNIPFGLKIDSEDLANAMHFLMEKLKTE